MLKSAPPLLVVFATLLVAGGAGRVAADRVLALTAGLLDFLAQIVADKGGRSVTRFTQSVATAVFLPVGA